MRFRDEAEQMPVAVEAPGPAVLHDLEARLVMAIEQLVGDAAGRRLIGQLQSLGAKPLYADDRDDLVRQNASDGGGGLEVFEAGHGLFVGTISCRLYCTVSSLAREASPGLRGGKQTESRAAKWNRNRKNSKSTGAPNADTRAYYHEEGQRTREKTEGVETSLDA